MSYRQDVEAEALAAAFVFVMLILTCAGVAGGIVYWLIK